MQGDCPGVLSLGCVAPSVDDDRNSARQRRRIERTYHSY